MIPYTTYNGALLNLQDIQPEDISLDAIAHSLAFQCRFNGHTNRFYSVAEHSMLLEFVVNSLEKPESLSSADWEARRMAALLHDAAEAYIGDVVTPVKQKMFITDCFQEDLTRKIFKAFDVPIEAYTNNMQAVDASLATIEGFVLIGGTYWTGQNMRLEATSYYIVKKAREFLFDGPLNMGEPTAAYYVYRDTLESAWKKYIDAKTKETEEYEDAKNS